MLRTRKFGSSPLLTAVSALILTTSPVLAQSMSSGITDSRDTAPSASSSGSSNSMAPDQQDSPNDHGPDGDRSMRGDTNQDGFLSKDEMQAAHQKRLDEMFGNSDTDQDGKLSRDELRAGRAKMRERMEAMREKRGGEKRGGEMRGGGQPDERRQKFREFMQNRQDKQ